MGRQGQWPIVSQLVGEGGSQACHALVSVTSPPYVSMITEVRLSHLNPLNGLTLLFGCMVNV